MLTVQEVELLAGILARAGVTQIEAIWVNGVLNRLRELAKLSAVASREQLKEERDAKSIRESSEDTVNASASPSNSAEPA